MLRQSGARAESSQPRRVALCHEWLTTFGGSEQVAHRIAKSLGIHDVFTLAANPQLAEELFSAADVKVITDWGKSRIGQRRWQWMLLFMPLAWRRLDLSDYDLVITSSHAFVNAIRVPTGATHVSYCHTPMRYAWEWRSELRRFPLPIRPLWPAVAAVFRTIDRRNAHSVSLFIANSQHVAKRIECCYGKRSVVLYPPIDTSFWTPGNETKEDFWLFAGRLVPYKRADVAVRAARAASVRLVVAGSGPELKRLKRLAGPPTEFVENPSNEELRALYRRAKALIFPGVEDFGMSLVEAQACGTPVVALDRGGAREAVADGRTGLLYPDNDVGRVSALMQRFDATRYSEGDFRRHVQQFSASRFDARLRQLVERVLADGSVSVFAGDDFENGSQQDLEVEKD